MPKYINPDEWIPADNFKLEDNAYETVKSNKNRIVVAGPGAGKTELLAQRACFLLQTNKCIFPKRILAISFKRDAAFNLAARVEKRVGKKLAKRFTSLTFDAFSKSLVDRFRQGLPVSYRPNSNYQIDTNPNSPLIIELFKKHVPGFMNSNRDFVRSHLRSLYATSYPLHSSEDAAINVLTDMIKSEDKSILTFPILSRLAQLLLNTNPKIVKYLQQTYSHIFLDEFQDTTSLQYDLLKSAFLNSENIITAVGDTKQRIMLWAGAMDGIFDSFKSDFSAVDLPLLMNFRSAPRLVMLQNHLTKELMGSDITCIARQDRDENEGVAEFWFFDDYQQESKIIASEIKKIVDEQNIDLREICLLYKQRPDLYANELQQELSSLDLYARVENDLQDLLVEPVIQFLINFLLATLSTKYSHERDSLLREYEKFNKIYSIEGFIKLEREIIKRLKKFKKEIPEEADWDKIENIIREEVEYVSFPIFSAYYPQYNERKFFDDCINRFFEIVKSYYEESDDLLYAVEKFAGKNCIPIMTIHKSKGLEFSIVFFIGFEDQNFWSYKRQPEEDTCSFFVALSRAKNTVYFTFSRDRVNNFGNLETRSIDSISPMYKALSSSGIIEGRNFRIKVEPRKDFS